MCFFYGSLLVHNKIINKSVSMSKNVDSSVARKKIQQYSYALTHQIGKGYSSQVFKGRNDDTDQSVAIKVIDMRMLKGEVHKALLASEIQVLKTFKRASNIIEVFDILTTKNNTYLVTELCEGGDLSKFISGKRGLPETQAINILKQIVNGYSEISSNRIIHRDLKPANILMKDGKIKIADFGFAMRSVDSRKYSSYNVGSPIYMPPEALNDNKYSFKSDIWALGVIFFELLTGHTPWKAKTEKQLGKQLISVPISKLIPKNLTQASVDFLEKTLTIKYDNRMGPDELNSFMSRFNETSSNTRVNSLGKTNGFFKRNEPSVKHIEEESSNSRKNQLSLNKNLIKTPKNLRKFTFMSGTGKSISSNANGSTTTHIQDKNLSLPKTASTINNQRTYTALQSETDRKLISKELLSQIHFCRFVFKLAQRINNKIDGHVRNQLLQSMKGLIFQKLSEVEKLSQVNSIKALDYRKTADYQKICQIVDQYEKKYQKEINRDSSWMGYSSFQEQLSEQIKDMFTDMQEEKSLDNNVNKEKVIILDYLITLRQLCGLLSKNNLELFHTKSKIQAIVEGTPAKVITHEHVRAISSKMKAIKLL